MRNPEDIELAPALPKETSPHQHGYRRGLTHAKAEASSEFPEPFH